MRIGSAPQPTPLAGQKAVVKVPAVSNPLLAPAVTVPKPGRTPLVVSMGDSRVELVPNELAKVVSQMNDTARIFRHTLRFEVSEDQDIRVKVVDTTTGQVVREIPPEKLMDIFNRMDDLMGVLMDERV